MRAGIANKDLFQRSLVGEAVDGMEETTPRAANLNTLCVRRLPVARAMPRAELPGSVTHLDIVSVSKLDLPHGGDGAARGMKYGLVAVDDASGVPAAAGCTLKTTCARCRGCCGTG